MKRVIFTYILIFITVTVSYPQKLENSLLWEVNGNGLTEPSYIYGTIHAICENDYFLDKQVVKKLKKADQLYLELDMTNPSEMLKTLKGFSLPDSLSLKGLLSENQYEKLERFMKDSLNMSLALFNKQKPFVVISIISISAFDCKTVAYENKFVELAKKLDLETGGLETVDFQLSLFDKIPIEEQITMLMESIDEYLTSKEILSKMIQNYQEQNIEKLYEIIEEFADEMPDFEKDFLELRNQNWVERFKDLSHKNSVFYAVGAGHLAGEKGFLRLLEKEGYTIKPLTNK